MTEHFRRGALISKSLEFNICRAPTPWPFNQLPSSIIVARFLSLPIPPMESENYKPLHSITAADIAALGIPTETADQFHRQLAGIIESHGAGTSRSWQEISKHLLTPELPFSFHQMMYYGCYKHFGPDPPAWLPDAYVEFFFYLFMSF